MSSEHQQFLFDLQLSYTAGNYHFCHAEHSPIQLTPHPQETLRERLQRRHHEVQLLSSRRLGQEADLTPQPEQLIIFGHLPFATPLVRADRIGIDTGAVYGNLLTAVQLPERIFFHA
jgi:serine/threonine protein phosphatase 1